MVEPEEQVVPPAPVVLRCASLPDALARLAAHRSSSPETSAVVVLPRMSAKAARRLVDAGADGVVAAEHETRRLSATVAAVAVGQVCLPREARRAAQRPQLTNREKQVMSLVVLGFTNGEIALKLVVAETTVKTHVSSALRKLGAASRAEAQKMITDPDEGLGAGILTIT